MDNVATIKNPILAGFYPDPSACRVGGDFYLVNSSFAYFPGLPVWHSRDLAHWEQIGNALDRASQLPLDGAGTSRGLFAPTIRHHAGRFYVVCTNVDNGGNFVVTAEDPAGPWSEPAWLSGAGGIDPSLFFDEKDEGGDGRAWYVGTRPAPEGERYSGNWEVWVQEFDPEGLRLVGDSFGIWRGALRECIWPEGPHVYRKDGRYYLFAAEGGTGRQHAVSVARSDSVTGPWVGNPSNPLITHRHLGKDYPLVNVGHGDLVSDPEGGWWLIHLASRVLDGCSNMGRETFIVPIAWEDGWPVASPGSGIVRDEYPAPPLPRFDIDPVFACETFGGAKLGHHWMGLRGPIDGYASLKAGGGLRLRLLPGSLRESKAVSYLCRRQVDWAYSVRTAMRFEPAAEGEAAGIALYQNEDFQYRLELTRSGGKKAVRLSLASGPGPDRVIAEEAFEGDRIELAAIARGQELSFGFGTSVDGLRFIATGLDGRLLSTERAGGFVGTTLGMFATSNGRASAACADFEWFEYRALPGSGR